MIGEILKAVLDECKKLLETSGGTIIFKTDYRSSKLTTYSMPLLIVDMIDAPESAQLMGGVTRVDWMFAFNSYNYEPDQYNDETGSYSTSLLDPIDSIRQHFQKEIWLTAGMGNLLNDYGFRFTLSTVLSADALDEDGIVKGYKIVFDSVAFDTSTDSIINSAVPLEIVTQVNNPPFD